MATYDMRLLFITQKIDQNDDDLAFTILWIQEFIKQGCDVSVICLQKGGFDGSFPVYSLGKEEGNGTLARAWRFLKFITTLTYDRVFVHMNPEYFTLGGWWWALRGIPSYLWYTHYTMTVHLWLAGVFAKRLFAATAQSMPQFEGNMKKTVVGHGIDTAFWSSAPSSSRASTQSPYDLLSVHRISRSKRLEIAIETLALLPKEYTLTVYGRPIDPEYFSELQSLVNQKGLTARVFFMGPMPMSELRNIYPDYRVMINMASETIDKTMLEGMLYGVFPVTTPNNSQAIGLPVWPRSELPEAIADFIRNQNFIEYSKPMLQKIVSERHSLDHLVSQVIQYIKK